MLANWAAARPPRSVDLGDVAGLRRMLAPVSSGYLRRLLRDSGLPLAPLVEGVTQTSIRELRRTLLALEQEYARGDPAAKALARRLVIEAKDHARWAARSPKASAEKKAEKEEMVLWMLTWLENPGAFPAWVVLRERLLLS